MQLLRDGVSLAYEEAGQGRPPIVLVHGWGMDRSVLRPLFVALCRSHRVVAVDLRGFGESDVRKQRYTIEGYSDDLSFVASALALEPTVVIGHSMGGLVALDFAARYHRQVEAAVVLEAMVVAPELTQGLRSLLAGLRSDRYRNVVAGLITYLVGPNFDPGERDRLLEFARSCPQHVLVSAMQGMLAYDSEAAASRVRCPILYVGTQATYADISRFQKLCPQLMTGQLVLCGHYFPLEVPEQLNPMIARFIQVTSSASENSAPVSF